MAFTTLLDLFNAISTATKLNVDTGAVLLSSAPASDTGQTAFAVRIISSLAAGGGGANAAAGLTGAAVPTSASYTGFNSAGNLVGISPANPLPVVQTGTLATNATIQNASIAVTGPLTDTQLRATPVPVSGTVAVSNAFALDSTVAKDATLTGGNQQAIIKSGTKGASTGALVTSTAVDLNTQALHTSVTNFPATQAVTGTVTTNTTLAAETTKVIGTVNVAAAQTIAVTQATSANLNATAILAAGSATIGSVKLTDGTNTPAVKAASIAPVATDTALVVAMSPNSTTFVQGVQSARSTGSIVATTTIVGPYTATNYNVATITISGTYVGVTAVFQGTDDGTNWYTLQGVRTDSSTIESGPTLLASTLRAWDVPIGALTQVRVQASAWTSGTAVIGVTFQTLPYDPGPAVGIANITGIGVAKATQGALAIPTQDLKDAGRNQTNYFMALPIVTTITDTLMSMTGYKGGVAVAATLTPAVVTTAKTYRIQTITITYVAIVNTAGTVLVKLRAQAAGVVLVGSPVVATWTVGAAAAVAGISQTVDVVVPDGLEFVAGTGIGITISGLGATQAAAAVGYGHVAINGYEY